MKIEDPKKLALPFSTVDMEPVIVDQTLYIQISKPEHGFIYFRKGQDYKACLGITVKSIGDKISTEFESDLIKAGEKVAYPILSFPNNLFRFDMELHTAVSNSFTSNSTISITG